MKLRVRILKQRGWVELEGNNPTVAELHHKIADSFLPTFGYSSTTQFSISLNGKDSLTDDEQTLASIGIVGGDLISLILPESSAPSVSVSSQNTANQQPSSSSTAPKVACVNDQQTQSVSPSMSSNMVTVDSEIGSEENMTACPYEPMLCSEALDGKVPHSLEILHHSAECTSPSDALIVVLHLLMLEAGYIPQGTGVKVGSMPEKWRNGGIYRLHYSHPLCEDGLAVLTCVPMANLIVVNALLKISDIVKSVKKVQLSPGSYVDSNRPDENAAEVYKDLRKLSCMFKDQLVYPLLANARQALNLPDVFGLVVQPLEIKLRIFRLLDVSSILSLSSVCRDLNTAINDQLLWRFLFLRDFRDTRTISQDWKRLYKEKYLTKKRSFHRSPLYLPRPLPIPPSQPCPFTPFPFEPHPIFPPGIIGGEYDERPQLPYRGDPVNPFLPGMGPVPGTLPPFRPLFDPTGSIPGMPPATGPRFPGTPRRGGSSDIRHGII
uniref:F-box only protein 7 n=1 Tax=Callorhinchus milii TaxID=7868 RepID=V9KJ44_CALMI|eukprot:gi/632961363/ref/XP_007896716.1/ PREDICTED: F-box only protein 7 [Callorhinchus milii]